MHLFLHALQEGKKFSDSTLQDSFEVKKNQLPHSLLTQSLFLKKENLWRHE